MPASNGSRPAGGGIVILGSTGSIGRSTLDVLERLPAYRVVGLGAHRDIATLERQVRAWKPKVVAVADEDAARSLKARLNGSCRVLSGPEGLVELAALPSAGTVVSAIVGSAGLAPTLEAAKRGKRIALANKESLVVGGALITAAAAKSGAALLPVDSEHSAIFQCLAGRPAQPVKRILLTASGGPFRRVKSLARVTVAQALKHPTWRMGRKITIDSATLMNKGLEILEARWLFNLPVSAIDVVIHPQSIVHSLVEFVDGSVLAQMGWPDMKLPIQVALTWPGRSASGAPSLDLARAGALTFEAPDEARFRCLAHARAAGTAGGAAPVVLNAANEVAVAAFLARKIGFESIAAVIGATLASFRPREPKSLPAILDVDREARAVAGGMTALAAA